MSSSNDNAVNGELHSEGIKVACFKSIKTNSNALVLTPEQSISHALIPQPDNPECVIENDKAIRLRILHPGDDHAGHVRVVENLLSTPECRRIISEAAKHGFTRPGQFDATTRDCTRLHTVDTALSEEMFSRLRGYLPEMVTVDGIRWVLNRFTHHWRYVRYAPGGHFRPHYDGAKMMPGEMSCFTLQIYLNHEEFSGGKTRFYTEYEPNRMRSHDIIDGKGCLMFSPTAPPTLSVTPRAGTALIFSHVHSVLHDGEPVAGGDKYILRGDVLYRCHSEDAHLLLGADGAADTMYCAATAARSGTRNFVGQVWMCACGEDDHGCRHPLPEQIPTDDRSSAALTATMPPPRPDALKFVLVSGKRASGKDFISDLLRKELSERGGLKVARCAMGSINKASYASENGIDLALLETDRDFKEKHRLRMIAHHAKRNQQDPKWCLKQVLQKAVETEAQVLLLSDLRTEDDLAFFIREAGRAAYGEAFDTGCWPLPPNLTTIRVDASEEARSRRGWRPERQKDTSYTEVSLDRYRGWSACIDNSENDVGGGRGVVRCWLDSTAIPRIMKNFKS